MEEVQKYECIYNKFSKDYKNKYIRLNSWKAMEEKFGLDAPEAERRYKNCHTSCGRYLKKRKSVSSGSGRNAVPIPAEFAKLKHDYIRTALCVQFWTNIPSNVVFFLRVTIEIEPKLIVRTIDQLTGSISYLHCSPTTITLEILEQRLAASHLYSPDASPLTFRKDKLLPLNRFPLMTLTHETDGNGSPDT